jgi:hypothetical protein
MVGAAAVLFEEADDFKVQFIEFHSGASGGGSSACK